MKTTLLSVSYDKFRSVINEACTNKVHKNGHTTLLYSSNRIIAAMQPARIDEEGRCHPVNYFVCA